MIPKWQPSILTSLAAVSLLTMSQGRPRFQDYPAQVRFRGRSAVPDFNSDPSARQFRTVIRTAAARGPNFAGAWTVVIWGCGTSCQSGVMVDARSGQIIDLPQPFTRDADYRRDSRLLVADPVDEPVQPFTNPWARFYEWTGQQWILLDSLRALPRATH
jgi:hypothetical protein